MGAKEHYALIAYYSLLSLNIASIRRGKSHTARPATIDKASSASWNTVIACLGDDKRKPLPRRLQQPSLSLVEEGKQNPTVLGDSSVPLSGLYDFNYSEFAIIRNALRHSLSRSSFLRTNGYVNAAAIARAAKYSIIKVHLRPNHLINLYGVCFMMIDDNWQKQSASFHFGTNHAFCVVSLVK